MEFGPGLEDGERIRKAESRPLFQRPAKEETLRITPRTRKRALPELVKGALQSDLRSNTRAAMDPFLTPKDWSRPKKRPKKESEDAEEKEEHSPGDPLAPETENKGLERQALDSEGVGDEKEDFAVGMAAPHAGSHGLLGLDYDSDE